MKAPMQQWQRVLEYREQLIQQLKRPVSFSEALSQWLYRMCEETPPKARSKRKVARMQFPFIF